MAKQLTHIRFEENEIAEIKQYADAYCKGNISLAVRSLCANALAPTHAQTAIEHRVESMLNDALEHMVKIQSCGGKATFANLALSSMFLPAIAESLRVLGEDRLCDKEGRAKEYFEEKLDTALYPIDKIAGCSQNAVFNKAWEYGGRLQAQSGVPSLYEATKSEH